LYLFLGIRSVLLAAKKAYIRADHFSGGGSNPVSHMATAIRGLMEGAATPGQVFLALIAPAVLTTLLAPVTLWLYRRR
jgi:hypothetical protein